MTRLKWLSLFVALLVAAVIVYLMIAPVPISPIAWTPQPAPALTGIYQQNSRLSAIERLPLGTGFAPEDVAVDSENRIYAGIDDGRIMRLQADGTRPEVFAATRGRPLGLSFDRTGNLIVADANQGLLSIGTDRAIRVLSTAADGVAFRCTNDLDVAADGTIYFTDASTRFPLSAFKADLLEHQASGRLLAYDPRTGATRVVLKELHFANGVAISPDQSFLLVVDTAEYRVNRVWLNGPKQGQTEVFIANLPGFPDGISSNGRDKFWLALVTPRDATLDRILPHPFLRKMVMRLPNALQPAPKRYSFVLALDLNGRVVENLQNGSNDCYAEIANAVEHGSYLYFGSIGESSVGRFALH